MRPARHLSLYAVIVPFLVIFLELGGFAAHRFQVSGNTLFDPDTLMRLAYLRHVLETQSWDHGFFARNNAPYGMVLHWTLPFNLFILGFVKICFFLTQDQALHYAGYWTGPVFCIAISIAAYWAGRQILSPAASAFTAALITFSPFLFSNYGERGEANHHVLLYLDMVLMAGLAFAWARRGDNIRIAILNGLMAGFSLWCSFELIIIDAALFAFLFLLWVQEGNARLRGILLSSAAFAATTAGALLVDPPYGGLGTIVYDHISLPLAILAALPLLVALAASLFALNSKRQRFGFLALAGLGISGFWLASFPSALGGVEGGMDPYVYTEWLTHVSEIGPLQGWQQKLIYRGTSILCVLLLPIVIRKTVLQRLALIALIVLSCMTEAHYRFAGYVVIADAFFLGYALDRLKNLDTRWIKEASLLIAFILCGAFYAADAAAGIFNVDIQHANSWKKKEQNCNPYDVRNLLNDPQWFGASPIVAEETNMTSGLLYWTNVRTLAGNYHRDNQGIKDSLLFFRDVDDRAAKDIARRRGIEYVLVCAGAQNPGYSFISWASLQDAKNKFGADYKPDPTLYTRLTSGNPPAWLQLKPWPAAVHTDLLLYRVERENS